MLVKNTTTTEMKYSYNFNHHHMWMQKSYQLKAVVRQIKGKPKSN